MLSWSLSSLVSSMREDIWLVLKNEEIKYKISQYICVVVASVGSLEVLEMVFSLNKVESLQLRLSRQYRAEYFLANISRNQLRDFSG